MTDFQVSIPVPTRKVCDQFISAFEGGSSYWLHSAKLAPLVRNVLGALAKHHETQWYDCPAVLDATPFAAVFVFDNPGKTERGDYNATVGNKASCEIGRAEITTGLQTMAEKSPQHFADLVGETGDATTGDVMVQYILFGEVIFG